MAYSGDTKGSTESEYTLMSKASVGATVETSHTTGPAYGRDCRHVNSMNPFPTASHKRDSIHSTCCYVYPCGCTGCANAIHMPYTQVIHTYDLCVWQHPTLSFSL